MRHLAFTLGHIVYNFDVFMRSYFATVATTVLAITAAACWLFRSKRPFAVVTACLMMVGGTYGLCEWTHLQHRAYCYARFGQFQCDLSAPREAARSGVIKRD